MLVTDLLKKRSGGIFYGWWIVVAGFLIQMLNGGLFMHSFGAYFIYIREEFGWSRTVLSGAFSLQQMESGILGPLQGWLIDKAGPRAVVRVGVVISGVGLMLFSRVDSILDFYIAFVTIALGSSLGGFMAVIATVTNWFIKKRSLAIGMAMAGMSLGGLLVPILAWLMQTYGWRSVAFASGIAVIAGGLPLAQLLRQAPEKYGMLPDGETPRVVTDEIDSPQPSNDPDMDFTAMEALKTRVFWFISLGHGAALLVVSSLMVHLIPHIVDRLGYSVASAGSVITLMTATMIFSQVSGGALGDRISKRIGLTACLLGHSIALFGLAFSTTIWQVAIFATLHGISWGARTPMVISIRADYFGRSSYATIMGFSSLIMMVGMMIGPLFAGVMADKFGDYRLAFSILAAITGLGSLLFVMSTKPSPPPRVIRMMRHRSAMGDQLEIP